MWSIIRPLFEYIQQMHTSILKPVYVYSDLIHVSAHYEAIFREVKYKCWIHQRVWNEIIKLSEPIYRCKMTIIGAQSLKVHNYNLLLIMCLFDWMVTQKASGSNSPSKWTCRDVSSTVNHTVLRTVVDSGSSLKFAAPKCLILVKLWRWQSESVAHFKDLSHNSPPVTEKIREECPLQRPSGKVWRVMKQSAATRSALSQDGLKFRNGTFHGSHTSESKAKPMISACIACAPCSWITE
jgi:hypothetical protein